MAREKILVIEDEIDIQELIRYNLAKEKYLVSYVGSGEEGLKLAALQPPDLVLLDLMLPGIDGLEVCRRLKADQKTQAVPVIMLTAKSEELDIVTGLEVGADDYLTKPFSPRILIARVRAALRRKMKESPDGKSILTVHALTIDPGKREVTLEGKPLDLTFTEFGVLNLLARRPGWVFSRYQIIDAIRGEGYPVTDRSVDVQIVGLRKKMGDCGHYIETIRGVGYRFREAVDC